MTKFATICTLLLLSLVGLHAWGQAIPAATRGALQVGAGVYGATDDQWPNAPYAYGLTFYSTLDLTDHFGGEADIHLMDLRKVNTLAEDSYELGPRFTLHRGRFEPYGKFLFGIGHTSVQPPIYVPHTPGTFFEVSFGGGLDYRVTDKIDARGDFEYQDWISFQSSPQNPGTHLNPGLATIGVAYRFY